MIRNGITIELDLPYQVREIILARPFVGRNGLGGGSFLRQKKTNEQNDSVLLRFVKPFNLFFKYCVGHFSTSLSFKGIAPQKKTLCTLPNPLPNYNRSGESAICGSPPTKINAHRAWAFTLFLHPGAEHLADCFPVYRRIQNIRIMKPRTFSAHSPTSERNAPLPSNLMREIFEPGVANGKFWTGFTGLTGFFSLNLVNPVAV